MDSQIKWLEPVPVPGESDSTPRIELCLNLDTGTHKQTPLSPLIALKNEIESITPESVWDDAKKLTNPYEFIFLSLQRRMASSMSAIHPLSRSFFKMIELWDALKEAHSTPEQPELTVHTAEGPGGFLEAIQYRCSPHTIPMIAMTLKSTEKSVPGWRKSQTFLQKFPKINITFGADGTGNLYNLANQDYLTQAATEKGLANVYTADGGFDFSADFNSQENTVQRLLVAEALAGLTTLRKGGTMILKLFDTKCQSTLEILWSLSLCFEQTGLIKPCTSRPANSERYWIGKGFRGCRCSGSGSNIPSWILPLFRRMVAMEAPHGWVSIFSNEDPHPWTDSWYADIQAFQEQVEYHQIVTIQKTFELIKSPTPVLVRSLLLDTVKHSRQWCLKHGIPLNKTYMDISDEAVADRSLEEALAPFQVSGGRTSLPTLSRLPPMRRVWPLLHAPQTPIGQAWRTELPASVLGRSPSQTVSGTPRLLPLLPGRPPLVLELDCLYDVPVEQPLPLQP